MNIEQKTYAGREIIWALPANMRRALDLSYGDYVAHAPDSAQLKLHTQFTAQDSTAGLSTSWLRKGVSNERNGEINSGSAEGVIDYDAGAKAARVGADT